MPAHRRPKLIINADDLGASAGRDAAIFELAARGIVTSASLLINGPTAAAATQRAARLSVQGKTGFRLGLHLNLSEGRALTGRSALTDAAGQLPGKTALRDRLDAGEATPQALPAERIALDHALGAEMRAQMERFCALTGTLPTHVDGHQHCHAHPRLARLLAPLMQREFGVHRIRFTSPEPDPALHAAWADAPLELAFHQRINRDAEAAQAFYRGAGLRSPALLIGRCLMGHRLTADGLRAALAAQAAHDNWIELMVHPGHPDPDDTAFGQSPARQAEYDVLNGADFANALEGITRAGWGDFDRSTDPTQRRILIYSKLQTGSGNATTAARLADDLSADGSNCVLFRRLPDAVPADRTATAAEIEDLRQMAVEEGLDAAIGIHLYRAGTLLQQAFSQGPQRLPYLLVASGTDLNNLQNSGDRAAWANALADAAGLITLTDAQMRQIETTMPHDTLPTHRAVLPQTPDIATDSTYSMRAELNLQPTQSLVLLPAGLRPVKDVALAIECAAQALIEHADHVFVVVGPTVDADYHAHCRSLMVEWMLRHRSLKGRLVMHDALPRADFLAAMKEASLILNTSVSEGLSNALIEAMGLGVPVLARDIPGNRGLVREGENGLLFNGLIDFLEQYRRLFAEAALRNRLIEGGRAEFARRATSQHDATAALVDAALPRSD